MNDSSKSSLKTLADAAQLAFAAARAAGGDFSGLAVQAAKWGRVLLGIALAVIIVLTLLMSLPLLVIQSLTPETEESAALLEYANNELAQLKVSRDAIHEEARSWIAEKISSFLSGGAGVAEEIDRGKIKEIARLFLDKSSHITRYVERDEEGNEEVYYVLDISVLTKAFHTVMDELRLSEIQRAIALHMFEVLHFNQNLTHAVGNSPQGVEIGDLTFNDGQIPVVYFNQCDARWYTEPYGKTGRVGSSACGPTALAMAVSSLTDRYIEPPDMAAWAYANGYRAEGNGSYHSLIYEGAKSFGLSVTPVKRGEGDKIIRALQSGKLVIVIMSKGHFTSGGHFIMLRGVTEDGGILVADPSSLSRSEQMWELSLIQNEASRNTATPFWILSD